MEYLPLAQLISGARQRQGLSLNAVARGMHAAAQREGTHSGATRQAILGYERGRIPHPDALRWLAAALDLPFDEVAAAARSQRRYRLELRLLGPVEGVGSGPSECARLDEDVERRELLALFGRAATAGLLTSTLGRLPALASTAPVDAGALEAVSSASKSYRQLWSTVPAGDLRDLVLGHLHLISRLLASAVSDTDYARLAAAASDTSLLAAWLAEDSWDLSAAQRHYREARAYAERSRDDCLQAYVAGCRSMWATMTGSSTEAVGLVQRARRLLPRTAPSAAHAWVAAREAIAHATAHDEPAMSSALLRAEEALSKANVTSEMVWPWVPMNDRDVSRYRGFAAVSCELPELAVPALTEGLDSLGTAPTKWRAYTLSKLAEAHVQAGDAERACDLGAQAFTIATQLGDTWSLMVVRSMRVRLMPMEATKAVRAFDERVLSTLLTLPR
ncbi:MAG TPA: helix-turn-helix transcriptional regulator [Actinomycetota bacterium]|nr:helix-turn-helix transcriptional regulator [Actinomycetota bacterium]